MRDDRQFLGRSDTAVLYVLLPLSALVALALVFLGAPQTLQGAMEATTLEGVKQTIAIGPVASQEAIKLLGDKRRRLFQRQCRRIPFENPGALSNMIESWSQLVVPVALLFAFGRMVGDRRQSYSLFAVMTIIFLVSVATLYQAEAAGNPLLTELGVDPVGGIWKARICASVRRRRPVRGRDHGDRNRRGQCDLRLAHAD